MEEKKDIKNIDFDYGEGVYPNSEKENKIIKNINEVLIKYIKEINKEDARVIVHFPSDGGDFISLKNISQDLQDKIAELFNNSTPFSS